MFLPSRNRTIYLAINLTLMATLKNGINGPFKGKVGSVVGSSRNDTNYIKGLSERTAPFTTGELKNQGKFALAQSWLKPLTTYVRAGFKDYNKTAKGFVAAKSFLMKNAIILERDTYVVDPSLMQVSFGDLPLAEDLAVELIPGNGLKFSWNPEWLTDTNPDDQVMLLAYNTANQDAYYTITGQFRKTGWDLLNLPTDQGISYEVYIAFVSADRTRQSHSAYLGKVTV